VFPAGVRDTNVFYTKYYPELLLKKKATLRKQQYPLQFIRNEFGSGLYDGVKTCVDLIEAYKRKIIELASSAIAIETGCKKLIDDLLASGFLEHAHRYAIIADYKNKEIPLVNTEEIFKIRDTIRELHRTANQLLGSSLPRVQKEVGVLLSDMSVSMGRGLVYGSLSSRWDSDVMNARAAVELKREELLNESRRQMVRQDLKILNHPGMGVEIADLIGQYI
jgi:hypothetical protein